MGDLSEHLRILVSAGVLEPIPDEGQLSFFLEPFQSIVLKYFIHIYTGGLVYYFFAPPVSYTQVYTLAVQLLLYIGHF